MGVMEKDKVSRVKREQKRSRSRSSAVAERERERERERSTNTTNGGEKTLKLPDEGKGGSAPPSPNPLLSLSPTFPVKSQRLVLRFYYTNSLNPHQKPNKNPRSVQAAKIINLFTNKGGPKTKS